MEIKHIYDTNKVPDIYTPWLIMDGQKHKKQEVANPKKHSIRKAFRKVYNAQIIVSKDSHRK